MCDFLETLSIGLKLKQNKDTGKSNTYFRKYEKKNVCIFEFIEKKIKGWVDMHKVNFLVILQVQAKK